MGERGSPLPFVLLRLGPRLSYSARQRCAGPSGFQVPPEVIAPETDLIPS